MAPDGQLALTVGIVGNNRRINGSFQLLPWLEGSFRYSYVPDFLNLKSYYDRSFGLKIRLFDETKYTPAISVGMRDILGSGIYASEYVVASKRWSDFDFTLGMGWGRLAQRASFANPLGQIFSSFKTRQSFLTAGNLNFGQFFHGPNVGLFGGVIWKTPIDDLELLAEYSSDKYNDEKLYGGTSAHSPLNIGAAYTLFDTVTLTGGWFYGSTYGVTASLSLDPSIDVSASHLGPSMPAASVRPPNQQIAALTSLIDQRKDRRGRFGQLPWVSLPSAQVPAEAALSAALKSYTAGVRDVELQHTTLMVDANLASLREACALYSRIASQIDSNLRTIAVSNFNAGDDVAICSVQASELTRVRPSPSDGSPPNEAPSPVLSERKIRTDLIKQGIDVEALSIDPSELWLYFTNAQYRNLTEAVHRISNVLTAAAPDDVEIFHLIDVQNGQPDRQFDIARSALERASVSRASAREIGAAIHVDMPPLYNPLLDRQASYPRFDWSIGPGLRESAFDPDNPLQIQLLTALDASLHLTSNFDLTARIEGNIYNNFNLSRPSDSLLPHVRSDVVQYYRHGINGVAALYGTYRSRLARDIFVEFKGGYLESMFAGAGGQILWRPDNERFTLGADLYEVWQRKFDRLYGLQPYHVMTGHVALYYESPWYGLNFNFYAGRYLAGDYGATFEVSRRFSTGVEIAAFATFTNVPFSKFGEGSFDKGIELRIPFEWGLPFYSASDYSFTLRSLTRDGGQRLDGDNSLYKDLRASSYGEVVDHIDDVTAP